MKEFITYIFLVSICNCIFFLTYKLFLHSATFFKFNRAYLLFGIFASFVIPLIQIQYDVYLPNYNILEAVPDTEENTKDASSFFENIWTLLFLIYAVGIILLVIRNLITYQQIHKLINFGEKTKTLKFTVIENNLVKSPFTIFKYILYAQKGLSSIEKELILKHEIAHINQKHWIDLLCSECALLLQWFNPMMWLYISSIKENHEFLADRAVIKEGYSASIYQAVLINQRFQGPIFSFTNSFIFSNQLNRLDMIKKEKSSSWKKYSILILVPTFGVFFWASAKPNYVTQFNTPSAIEVSAQHNEINKTSEDNLQDLPKDKKPLYIVDGEEINNIENIKSENIEKISVLKEKSATDAYGKKGKNGVIIITTKK